MTIMKSTAASIAFRTKHLGFWNEIMKISLTGICDDFNGLTEKILKYSINFTNEECFYISESLFELTDEQIYILTNMLMENNILMGQTVTSMIIEIESKINDIYKNKKKSIICTHIKETPYISTILPEEQINLPFYNINYNLWDFSKMGRIYFTMIMKYLHDVSIRMAMLKTTIIKIELVCYSKNPAHNFNQYNKKRAFDAIINEQLLKLMELNNELVCYSGKLSKLNYYTDSQFLYPNVMALIARYY